MIRRLRALAEQGKNYEQMAAAVGFGMTKSAVSGLCRRAKPPIITEGARQQALARAGKKPVALPPVVLPPVKMPRFTILGEIEPESVHLMDLRQSVITQCRAPLWPDRLYTRTKVKAEEAHFCGKRTKSGSSYCPEHHAQFWMKEQPKPRKAADPKAANTRREIIRLKHEMAGE